MAAPLQGSVALVAGATRGAGRAIAVELGAAGATVYVTGRTTRVQRSDLDRPETIEDTAELVDEAATSASSGGRGIAVRVDHSRQDEVRALAERIRDEAGRLDVLVNDVWGGDHLADWERPLWEQDLERGLTLFRRAVETHVITSRFMLPLMLDRAADRGTGLVVEVTDGISPAYRGSFFYDLAKATVIRLAVAQAAELKPHRVAAVALTPGFLRSEAMLEGFGVTEQTWRDAVAKDPHFAQSETPAYIGRAVVALASDPNVLGRTGTGVATWTLAKEYGFTDLDGTQPDWGTYARETLNMDVDWR